MLPHLLPGHIIVGSTRSQWQKGDVVIAQVRGREVIKRVRKIRGDRIWLQGDNHAASTDSRQYGSIDKSAILGSMKYSLPSSKPAPKLRHRYGAYMGWAAALILIAFAIIHLFRIDTFIPELQRALGNNRVMTLMLGSWIVVAEVFALPFLFRMRLSRLAQYISGALSVLAPLFWMLVAIWTINQGVSTAQLGEFHSLPSTWLLVVANALWLVFAYGTIWALGYDETFKGIKFHGKK